MHDGASKRDLEILAFVSAARVDSRELPCSDPAAETTTWDWFGAFLSDVSDYLVDTEQPGKNFRGGYGRFAAIARILAGAA